jgi:hypothetical protein
MKPCIKYDAEKWSDGSGAQLQRIAAVYSISQEFGLNYIHQEILHIESNPGDGFETLESKSNFIRKLNKSFRITHTNCSRPHTMAPLKYRKIMKFRLGARMYFFSTGLRTIFSGKHFLYVCDNPYPILENYPSIYRHFTNRFGKKDRYNEKCIQIQMHVRGSKNGNQLMSSRHVELSWYVEILKSIHSILKLLDLKYRVIIHTDAPLKVVNWEPLDMSAATEKFWKSANVMNHERKISLTPIDFQREFNFVENLEVIRDIDPVQAWEMMSKADVLILGRSSFSIIAGLINNHSLTIAPTYRHKFPSGWLIKENDVEFSRLQNFRLKKYFTSLSNGMRRIH